MKVFFKYSLLTLTSALVLNSANAFTEHVYNDETANDEIIENAVQQVHLGGTANNAMINEDGIQHVWGVANNTTINDGGEQYLYLGGVSNNTTINNSGAQIAMGKLGGTTTVNQGGIQILSNYQENAFSFVDTDSKIVIDGGTQSIGHTNAGWTIDIDAATASQIQIKWGFQYIVNGSSIDGMVLSGLSESKYTEQQIKTGSSATNTIVNAHARQFVLDDGTATGTIVNADGVQVVNGTGIATGTIVNDGGLQRLQNGGTSKSTTIASGGVQSIGSGSTAEDTVINNGGEQDVWGLLSGNTILNTDGRQFLLDGFGIVDGATVTILGGTQNIGQGSGADATDIDAATAAKIIFEHGTQNVFKDSSIDGMTVIGNGGTALQNIDSYGTATNTTVGANGEQVVYSYATSTGTILNGGKQEIHAYANVSNTTVNNGGQQIVMTGAEISNTTINNGGTATINRGATLNGGTVNAGGVLELTNASNNTVSDMNSTVNDIFIDGGTMNMHGGFWGTPSFSSVANNTVITGGGIMNVGSGTLNSATANNTAITDGTQNVYGKLGGTTTIGADGVQNLFDGMSFNTGSDIWLNGGTMNIKDGLMLLGSRITFLSGTQNVEAGATAVNMNVASATSATQNVHGKATGTTLGLNGVQNVQSGGVASNATVNDGGIQNFLAGSAISGIETVVNVGGVQNINAGADIGSALAYSTIAGGTQNVHGTASYTILNDGIQNVMGTAGNTTVNGGTQNFRAGSAISGIANIVNNGGVQNIDTGANIGGAGAYATILGGGVQNIYGTANNMIVNGGTQNVYADALARNTTVGQNGQQIFNDKSSIGGTDNIIQSGGSILFDSENIGVADASSGGIGAAAGTVLTFNGGRMLVGNAAGTPVNFHDNLAIRGTGIIEFKLSTDTANDFYTFEDIAGTFSLDFKHSNLDVDLFNGVDNYGIIQNNSDDTSLTTFKTLAKRLDIGQYSWNIVTDYDTGLTSIVKSERTSTLLENSANFAHSARSMVEKMSNSMHKRVGELQWLENTGNASSGGQSGNGIWARGIFKKSEHTDGAGANIGLYGAEFGYDYKLKNTLSNKFFIGVMGYAALGNAEFKTENASADTADLNAYGVGIYGIWLGANGWFADLALRQHFVSQDVTAYAAGFSDAVTYDSSNTATSLNLDFGRQFVFGTGNRTTWFLTPHAQINGAYVSGSDFTMSNDTVGKIEDTFNAQASFNLMGGPRWNMSGGGNLQIYAKAGYIADLSDDSSVKFAGLDTTISQQFNAGGLEFGGGLNYRNPGKRLMLYIDAGYRTGDQYSEMLGTTGIRYEF